MHCADLGKHILKCAFRPFDRRRDSRERILQKVGFAWLTILYPTQAEKQLRLPLSL